MCLGLGMALPSRSWGCPCSLASFVFGLRLPCFCLGVALASPFLLGVGFGLPSLGRVWPSLLVLELVLVLLLSGVGLADPKKGGQPPTPRRMGNSKPIRKAGTDPETEDQSQPQEGGSTLKKEGEGMSTLTPMLLPCMFFEIYWYFHFDAHIRHLLVAKDVPEQNSHKSEGTDFLCGCVGDVSTFLSGLSVSTAAPKQKTITSWSGPPTLQDGEGGQQRTGSSETTPSRPPDITPTVFQWLTTPTVLDKEEDRARLSTRMACPRARLGEMESSTCQNNKKS